MKRTLIYLAGLALFGCVELAPDADTLAGPAGADPAADLAPAEGLAPSGPAGLDSVHTPDLVPSAGAEGAPTTLTVASRTGLDQGVVATLPSGRRVVLGADDVMPGGFRAASPHYKLTAVYWVGR